MDDRSSALAMIQSQCGVDETLAMRLYDDAGGNVVRAIACRLDPEHAVPIKKRSRPRTVVETKLDEMREILNVKDKIFREKMDAVRGQSQPSVPTTEPAAGTADDS